MMMGKLNDETKGLTVIGLVLGLLLTLANDALAFYNPQTGRWLSRDPIGERAGPLLYGYVGNDPISLIDILGLGEYVEGSTPPPNSDPLDRSTWNTMKGGFGEITRTGFISDGA